jgi:hypothetical protein
VSVSLPFLLSNFCGVAIPFVGVIFIIALGGVLEQATEVHTRMVEEMNIGECVQRETMGFCA